MMKQRKPYKTYTREFKQEAVRLMESTNRPATEVAREIGIRRQDGRRCLRHTHLQIGGRVAGGICQYVPRWRPCPSPRPDNR